MAAIPEVASKAWDDRKGAIILTTVDADGVPNSIWASCVKKFGEDKLVVADNFFNKTRANLQAPGKGALLLITNAGKSYQFKGSLGYATAGDVYDDMKSWNGERPGVAAAVLHVEEVYSGAEKLL